MYALYSGKCYALGCEDAHFFGLQSWIELVGVLRPSSSDGKKEKEALPASATGDMSSSRLAVLSYGKSSAEAA